MSRTLFNLVIDWIMRSVGYVPLRITKEQSVEALDYSDDIALFCESVEEALQFLNEVNEAALKVGLFGLPIIFLTSVI